MTEPILSVTTTDGAHEVVVLAAAGEIDHDSRRVLGDAADAALRDGRRRLVVDLAAVEFCDSGGLSLFVDLHRRATAVGGQLRLAGARPPVVAVLHATNLDRLVPLHPTVTDAIHAAAPTG